MNDIAHRIRDFNKDRLPVFSALKYQAMAENPFRFFRGTAHLFYEDLGNALPQYPLAWICGDLHLENFGSYKGDNRLVYFDVNDFDEGILASAGCELARMTTSIFTGFASLGFRYKEAKGAATHFLSVYAATLAKGKARYLEPQTADGIVRTFLDQVCERKQKDLIRLRTIQKDDRLRLKLDHIRLFPLDKDLKKQLMHHVQDWLSSRPKLYKHFLVQDASFRIAGTGSLGLKRYLFLVRSGKDPKKHLLIDMKQAIPSCLARFSAITQPAWTSEAERVVAIQDRMQNVAPALLGTTSFREDSYVLREMQPMADKIDFRLMKDRAADIECVISDMALMAASAQLRAAARQGAAGPDELIAFGQDNHQWPTTILEYAAQYAATVTTQYDEYFKQYKSGYFEP